MGHVTLHAAHKLTCDCASFDPDAELVLAAASAVDGLFGASVSVDSALRAVAISGESKRARAFADKSLSTLALAALLIASTA